MVCASFYSPATLPLRPVAARGTCVRRMSVALLATTLGGAAGAQQPAPAAEPSAGGDAARRAASVAVAAGDRVRVRVWREPTLSDELTIDERGDLVLPRVGRLHVSGWAIAALQDTLTTRYGEYLRNPSVAVTVLRRIAVQGEVRAPNLYYVDATKTLREVLAEAGGVTEAGNPGKLAIIRDGRPIRVPGWERGEALATDLRSGDQVFVPRRSWLERNALAVASTVGALTGVAVSVYSLLR